MQRQKWLDTIALGLQVSEVLYSRDERTQVVEYLIEEQSVDPNFTDDEGWNPLYYACR